MTNIEVRRKILEMTYERFKEHPYYRITPKEFKETLNIDIRELHYNIIYLEEKGYLELQKPLEGSLFVGARITTRGMDLVEDEYQFDTLFPVNVNTAPMQISIFKEFDLLIDKINTINELSVELKEILVEEIKGVQKELKRISPSYTKVKSFVNKIKGRDSDIYDEVRAILNNPVVVKILSDSAKKELDQI